MLIMHKRVKEGISNKTLIERLHFSSVNIVYNI